ncbi:phosphoinositide 3-kinase adapter protein 1 isoform X2 [Neocloeon triangulifer]|nr:phosphoinositide 3-kinase adapter protein 1 isoform X2 [Neocloeon triangulifer]XP_059470510.1 phosphoinositide 3-kinase adapter protein 1 isoform X2 [Neocloeon triangulifer]
MPPMRSSGSRDDILILSNQQSHVANLWANYLSSCFEQMCQKRNRPPFRILRVGLDDIVGAVPFALEERIVQVKLKLVIMCPMFLQQVMEHPKPSLDLTKLLSPNRVLAMLLGVEEEQVTEQHRAAIANFNQWQRVAVRNKDAAFVSEFLNDSMAILTRVAQEEQSMNQNKAAFSLQPKKVNNAHNKVLVMLNEPVGPEDNLKITISKCGETVEVLTAKKRNPYTIMFTVPESCLVVSMLVGVQVEKNGVSMGCRQIKCESRMRELDQLLRNIGNPLDFICQTLGVQMGERDQLDNYMVSAFQKNVPPNFNLLQSQDSNTRKSVICSEEYPTLLHFAAKFGLEKLVWQLMECPGGDVASEMRNCHDQTPTEIAELAGHAKVANTIRGYTQMNEFTNIYSYMKMTAENKGKYTVEDTYNLPRPLNETYQVPPAARPFRKASTSSNGSSDADHPLEYLRMNSLKKNSKKENHSPNHHPRSLSRKETFVHSDDSITVEKNKHHTSEESIGAASASKQSKSREQLAFSTDDELVEIFNDFKNNVYTLAEVEKLVESWKNRNDVQQSLIEKQEYFKQLRADYDRIQNKMKEDMKRTTPFDKLKKFFFRGKEKSVSKANQERNNNHGLNSSLEPNIQHGLPFRPTSSLSINSNCSSSSSERMSTGSNCSGTSLGDSGTHSDHEDRKAILTNLKEPPQIVEEEEDDSLNHEYTAVQNYSVPPLPRPVMEAKNKPKVAKIHLEELPPLPAPNRPCNLSIKEEDPNAYIIPECLLNPAGHPDTPPVTPHTADSENAPDYMNWSAPQDKMPSYMNLVPPPVPPRLSARQPALV